MNQETAPLVQILVSTYNGEAYLEAQLESLLQQTYPNLRVLIRDDGSTDGTVGILRRYQQAGCVDVQFGANLGVVGSFFALLEQVLPAAAYVAFCDQDDVWHPEKIRAAVDLLEKEVPASIPGLYCGGYTIVDEGLRQVAPGEVYPRGPSFANALVQNIAPGCAMVLNRAAVTRLQGRQPKDIPVHDWWFYLVVSALGKVVYDPRPFVLYRQHGSNVIGARAGFIGRWAGRIRRHFAQQGKQVATNQARELYQLFGDEIPDSHAALLKDFVTPRKTLLRRLAFARQTPVHRQNKVDDLIFRVLLVLDRV